MKHQSICLVLAAITLAGCGCSPSQASTTSSSAQSSTGGGGAVSVQSNVSIHVHVPGEALEENRVEPTCTEAGHYDLVVYCEECGEELSRETISLSAGHSFGVPTYAWNADYSECTATRVCEKDPTHVESETATAAATVIEDAGEMQDGKAKYVATFTNEAFEKQEIEAAIPAIGTLDKLTFTLMEATDSYYVSRASASIEGTVYIPSLYQGKPVDIVSDFRDCANITDVIVAEGVKKILGGAFESCSSLQTFVAPTTLTVLDGALVGCNAVTSLTLPFLGITADSKNAFIGHVFGANGNFSFNENFVPRTLRTVRITEPCKYIGYGAFYHCTWIKDLIVPDTLEWVSDDALFASDLNYHEEHGVKFLGNENNPYVYAARSGEEPFDGILPPTCRIIGRGALYSTEIADLTLPDGIVHMCKSALGGLPNLASLVSPLISVPNETRDYKEVYFGYLFGADSPYDSAGRVPTTLKDLTFTSNVTSVPGWAFCYCENIQSISLPATIATIDDIGSNPFYRCLALETVNFEGTMAEWNGISKPADLFPDDVPVQAVHCSDGDVAVRG